MRNYDTTNGLPYPRVTRIIIDYPETGQPTVEYIERLAIVDAGGAVRLIDGGDHQVRMQLPGMHDAVGLIVPSTGQQTQGQTSVRSVLLGMTALIRRDQLLRDGVDNPLQPLPEEG